MTSAALILPTYGHLTYAVKAAETFLATSPKGSVVLLVDDASKKWQPKLFSHLGDRCQLQRFEKNKGLTRGWNWGLNRARELKIPTSIAGNSDLLFPDGWFTAIESCLAAQPSSLIGPVTNAPGHRRGQEFRRHLPKVEDSDDPWIATKVNDNPDWINSVQQALYRHNGTAAADRGPLNGYCMAALTETWWRYAFDSNHVFNPDPRFRMVRQEDELMGRWRRQGGLVVVVSGSFVFHYRGVSRGRLAIKGTAGRGWYRVKPKGTP